jgi:hypothetical protein
MRSLPLPYCTVLINRQSAIANRQFPSPFSPFPLPSSALLPAPYGSHFEADPSFNSANTLGHRVAIVSGKGDNYKHEKF